MISGPQAEEELATVRTDLGWKRNLTLQKVFAPSLAREIVATINSRDEAPLALVEQLDALSVGKRAKVFSAISPWLGDALALWWRWAQRAPYQLGWTRRAYRSTDPVHSLRRRFEELTALLRYGVEYPRPLTWHATWLVHLPQHIPIGGLLASAIDEGNDELRSILIESANARHSISGPSMQGHIALLASSDPANWEAMAVLLRAAGRAEGLRQSILETVDLAHPGAFARMIDVILENDLARFAGSIRAASVWFGDELDVRQAKGLTTALQIVRQYLAHPPTADSLSGREPLEVFLGLWSLACSDAPATVPVAARLLASSAEGTRLAAARLLADLAIPAAGTALIPALNDDALPVYAAAVTAWPVQFWSAKETSESLEPHVRSALMGRIETLGRSRDVQTGVLGVRRVRIGAAEAADVIVSHTTAGQLDPAVARAASANGRFQAARKYATDRVKFRGILFDFLDDRSSQVRGIAQEALTGLRTLRPEEVTRLEDALSRKASDVRATAVLQIGRQPPDALRASIARLRAGSPDQQRAASELSALTAREGRSPGRPSVEDVPEALRFTGVDRTPAIRPTSPSRPWVTYHAGCALVLRSLAAWLDEHADTEVQSFNGIEPLANVRWFRPPTDGSLPFPELMGPWWERISPRLTDGGVELALLYLRGQAAPSGRETGAWVDRVNKKVLGVSGGLGPLKERIGFAAALVGALAKYAWRESWNDVILDYLDEAATGLPAGELLRPQDVAAQKSSNPQAYWGHASNLYDRDPRVAGFGGLFTAQLDLVALPDAQLARLWRTLRFLDEPEGNFEASSGAMVAIENGDGTADGNKLVPDQPFRFRPATSAVVAAYERGVASRADLVDALIGVGTESTWQSSPRWSLSTAAHDLTNIRPEPWAAGRSTQAVVDEVRRAVIDNELMRGDLSTPFTRTAKSFRSAYGAEGLVKVLKSLGDRPFARGYSWNDSRESTLSRLVRIHQPSPEDTAESLGELVRTAGISERRMVEAAVYAPQWAQLIEEHLGWPGFASAIWWVHAHTKDEMWSVDREIRASWETAVSQRTPLDTVDLVRGAADVDWFRSVYEQIGEVRFARVIAAAKYASTAGGHKRAELFASALVGDVDANELLVRVREKRNQDSVRALGLLPLPDDGRATLLKRYEILREFVFSDRTSGSQRRASESTAVEVGMENLARTAGYRDPQRLTWAMEVEAIADLARGPVTAEDRELVVALSIDADGQPLISITQAGKRLAAVPAKSRKQPEIAGLQARATALRKQTSRIRASLEAACVLGDIFDEAELAMLLAHPVLAPMLRSLVLVDAEGLVGFLADDARTLLGVEGSSRPIGAGVRIAHPLDLLQSGDWPEFQRAVMSRAITQPFKQVFRELYTLSDGERDEAGTASRRYGGHQLEARSAGGIFASRGWVADFEVGFARTFHREKITVWCQLVNGWGSPAEVEDATIADITFHPAGEWHPMKLEDVPGRVFSEAMRDLDLVVSVAHSSGVDPETSESSAEMRGRLVDETAELLGLTNVEVGGHHARVKGKLGTYSIHLGSGVVHRTPGNAVCIVPVSAQHRGRIFLPFADDDPRTAEIVAKAVLLARDDQIKDPTIVQQLVR